MSSPTPPSGHRPQQPQPSRPPARSLRSAAARAVRASSPPTVPIALPGGGDTMDETSARHVIDLALRLGEALLSTGASASEVTATVLRLADAYGMSSCHVDVTFTSITLSYHRGEGDEPMTVMRVVRSRGSDFTRLENLQALVRDAAAGQLGLQEARARLVDVVRAPHPYRRWLVTAALAGMGASIAALFGGGPGLVVLSAVTTALVDRTQRTLTRRGLPAFFTQAVGAAIPTLVAVGLLVVISRTDVTVDTLPPSLIVAAGIIVLLAGLSVLGAAQDAIDGYYVTAAARGLEVLMLTLGIVVGVGLVLGVAQQAGVALEISVEAALTPNRFVRVTAAIAVSCFFALSAYTRIRSAAVAAAGGGIGWVTNTVASELGAGPATSAAVAAALIGLLAQVVTDRWRIPSLVLTTAAIVPLLPGLTVYRGLFQLVQLGPTEGLLPGLTTLITAAGIGMGLAGGVSLGNFIGRPLRTELDRWHQRALTRSTAGVRDEEPLG